MLEILQKLYDRDQVERVEGVRFHLKVHKFRHLCDVLRNGPVVFGEDISDWIRPIINSRLEAIVCRADHLQLILTIASFPLTMVVSLFPATACIR